MQEAADHLMGVLSRFVVAEPSSDGIETTQQSGGGEHRKWVVGREDDG